MPELPEVEVIRAGLAPAVTDAVIEHVEVLDQRSLKRHQGSVENFVAELEGETLAGAVRRGKFLWFPLHPADSGSTQNSQPRALLAHLGMSGQLLLRDKSAPEDKHTRVRLHITHPIHGPLVVNFADQRIFGSLALDDCVELDQNAGFSGKPSTLPSEFQKYLPTQVHHIARDVLDPAFDLEDFCTKIVRRKTQIKRAMLDQTLISGIGNIYIDEALWRAQIHYATSCQDLSTADVVRLFHAVTDVLEKALAEGGTSFDSQYVNVNGEAGYFVHSLNVYGKTGDPCPRCGTPITRKAFMNRPSHYCPQCQQIVEG